MFVTGQKVKTSHLTRRSSSKSLDCRDEDINLFFCKWRNDDIVALWAPFSYCWVQVNCKGLSPKVAISDTCKCNHQPMLTCILSNCSCFFLISSSSSFSFCSFVLTSFFKTPSGMSNFCSAAEHLEKWKWYELFLVHTDEAPGIQGMAVTHSQRRKDGKI